VLLAVTVVPAAAGAPLLRMGQVVVTAAKHSPITPYELSAFVPTLSSGLCQITLAESDFPISGTTVFCGVRQVDGVDGLFIHIFLPDVPPLEAIWVVNLFQEGARGYGDPIAYNPD
jgi:hypothetical protein